MSRKSPRELPVLEWSPSGLRAWNPSTQTLTRPKDLQEAREQLGPEIICAISRRQSFIKPVRLPNASKSEVEQVLAVQVGSLFPVPGTELAYDAMPTDDVNPEGRLNLVCAVKSETLHDARSALHHAGFKVHRYVPMALATPAALRLAGLDGGAYIEETPEGLAIDAVAGGVLRATRVVPSNTNGVLPKEIALTFALANVPPQEPTSHDHRFLKSPERAVPIPSLGVLSESDFGVNLMPPEDRVKREKALRGRTLRITIALWVCALWVGYIVWDQRTTESAMAVKGAKRWQRQIASLKSSHNLAQAKFAKLNTQVKTLDLGMNPKQRMADVTTIFANLAPQGTWLTGVSLERGKEAQLRGTAMNEWAVNAYLKELSEQSRFRDVRLIFSNKGQIEEKNVVMFSIGLRVVGNLPLDSEVLK